MGTPIFSWFFSNFLRIKRVSFIHFRAKREFFIGYIDTSFGFNDCLAILNTDGFGRAMPDTSGTAGAFAFIEKN